MQIQKKEKESAGIVALESKLSEFSHRTNNPGEFLIYLEAKRTFDCKLIISTDTRSGEIGNLDYSVIGRAARPGSSTKWPLPTALTAL